MNKLLDSIIDINSKYTSKGKVASYIPELSKISGDDLGICVVNLDGKEFCSGDCHKKFTMQSVSKVVTLMLAILDNGKEYVFSQVGMDASSDPFNSIVSLEDKNANRPLNPMINSGAIAVVSLIHGENTELVFKRILDFIRKLTGNKDINLNKDVYLSEKRTGDRNRALAYFMKGTNVIQGNVDELLDIYFKQCSLEVTCRDLARIGAVLANNGVAPWSGEKLVPACVARIIKTIMVTCGMYDASGDVAVNIGIPCKSGVGGGIMGAVPGRMGIGVYGPSLDTKGNSIAGLKMLEALSKELDLSIFT